jgi:periplasmic protein CpxP/Spy
MKLTLKSLGLAAVLVAGLAASAVAGTPVKDPMSPERIKERVARMKTDLSLSDEQATQIEQLMTDSAAKAEAIRKGAPADSQQSWDQLRQNHEQSKEKIRAVLSEEQRTRMDQLQKDRRSQYNHRPKGETK